MSTNNQTWGNPQIGIVTVLLVILLIWALSGHRHFFGSTRGDIKSSVQDAGQDIKDSGRDAAASIRRTVQ